MPSMALQNTLLWAYMTWLHLGDQLSFPNNGAKTDGLLFTKYKQAHWISQSNSTKFTKCQTNTIKNGDQTSDPIKTK